MEQLLSWLDQIGICLLKNWRDLYKNGHYKNIKIQLLTRMPVSYLIVRWCHIVRWGLTFSLLLYSSLNIFGYNCMPKIGTLGWMRLNKNLFFFSRRCALPAGRRGALWSCWTMESPSGVSPTRPPAVPRSCSHVSIGSVYASVCVCALRCVG